jgi:serine/threonine protein kinase
VVKLADFGIAHLIGSERITTIGTVIGTAGYLSPEQVFGGEPGPAADIYSLGLVVLEALTGVREYPGTPVEAVAARAARDPRIPSSLPEDWRGLIAAMTARDPGLRPTALEVAVMARELAPQLEGWVPEQPEDAATEPTRILPTRRSLRRPHPSSRRRRGIVATGAVAGAILAVVSTLALGSLMAPASEEPQTVPTTPRPTPSVVAPPATVAPAVVPSPEQSPSGGGAVEPAQQQPAPQQQPAQPPADSKPNKGPGNNNGNNPAPGKGHSKP